MRAQTTTEFPPIDPLPERPSETKEFGKLSVHQPFSVIYVAFNKVEYRKIDLILRDGVWFNALRINGKPGENLYAHFNADAIVHI